MSDELNSRAKTWHRMGGMQRLAGGVLAVAGLFWLAHKAGWIPTNHTGILWPVLVILVGVIMVVRGGRHTRRIE